jgi:hypothetical protein
MPGGEDLIPEFKAYAPTLAAWDGKGGAFVGAEDFKGLSRAPGPGPCRLGQRRYGAAL